ncbi:MAG: (2Fe-2S)-binding protein [bacterium]
MIDYYKKLGKNIPCELLSQGVMICHCFQVTRDTIRNAVMANRLESVEDVTNFTKAGGGCGECHHDIEELLRECWEKLRQAEEPAAADQPVTTIQTATAQASATPVAALEERIRELLVNDVARALRTDGGDIELVAVSGKQIFVRLTGACAACRASEATIKGWVEHQLREHIDEELEVIEVKS